MSHLTRRAPQSPVLPGVIALLQDDLQDVEQLLAVQLCRHESLPLINEMARQSCLAGGKRLRPILLLLAARTVGEVNRRHITLAASIEMIHAATLVHDDILDGAGTRRHRPTVNSKWDNHSAVLFGDYLFTNAFYLASTAGDANACQIIGQATNQVCEGELQQNNTVWNFETTIESYFEIIGKKTASLCACATGLGARFAQADSSEILAWERMGRQLGLAFQIVDDILDFQGDPADCGKTLGTDLATGKPTLPVLIALSRLKPAERRYRVNQLMDRVTSRREICHWMKESGSIDMAWERARSLVDDALAVAARYSNDYARAFAELGQFLLRRNH